MASQNYLTVDEFLRVMQHYATKEDLARLETQIARLETKLTIRLGAIVVAVIGAGAALVALSEHLW